MNMYQPRSMVNYSSTGFMKTRVPDRLFHKLHNFWQENRNEGVEEWPERVSTYQNTWTIPTQIVKVDNRTLPGGGPAFAAHIASTLREVVESWTGMRMATTSTYGIRVYQNGSILAPHVDRLPLVTSIIVNVDQDVNDPWPLEVYDHDGVAQNVTLLPGEMLLYESHSVIHGRPFPLNGSYFANLCKYTCTGDNFPFGLFVMGRHPSPWLPLRQGFERMSKKREFSRNHSQYWTHLLDAVVHFEPIAPLHAKPSDVRIHQYFPPYIVPGSSWEVEWRETNPRGWPLFREPWTLIERGDLSTLQFLAQADPSRRLWNVSDDHGQQLLYHACLHGHLDIVAFLVEHGVDVNHIAATTGQTALSVSDAVWGPDSAISQYLRGHGAVLDPHMLLQNRGFGGGGATRNRTAEWTEL